MCQIITFSIVQSIENTNRNNHIVYIVSIWLTEEYTGKMLIWGELIQTYCTYVPNIPVP